MPSSRPAPSRAKRTVAGSRLSAAEIESFFAALAAANPAPHTELVYSNPFTLLVAVVLSAQATDLGVNKATRALFAVASTPAAMVALGEDEIRRHVQSIGLFRTKAKNVLALSRMLLERHAGAVPDTREELEALPGVGRKTANVVLNEAFGVPTIAVDTHVFRVANRTGLAPGATPEAVGFQDVSVTEANHPFAQAWWPRGHVIGWEHAHINEMNHLLECIARDTPVGPYGATFEDGYRNAVICDAVTESAQRGVRVAIQYEA